MDARASIQRGLSHLCEAACTVLIHPEVAKALLSLGEVQLRLWKLEGRQKQHRACHHYLQDDL